MKRRIYGFDRSATIFEGIISNDNNNAEGENDIDTVINRVRGAHPGNALLLYVNQSLNKDTNEATELLIDMRHIHRAASVNSEGLRKLVKKFDRHHGMEQKQSLSCALLPMLYSSSLYAGQNMMQDSLDLLRELLEGDEYETNDDYHNSEEGGLSRPPPRRGLVRVDSERRHQESVGIRVQEVHWLKTLIASIPASTLLPHLVAHRGFHSTKDRNDKRPVENSLAAYEMAWTCGVELCECDIALTKDEKLVLAHDADFYRLALDSNSGTAKRKVGDLTFKEIISMPLTSGARPPLLIDVLRSASAISERAKLVIEIKPGNQASALALARLLARHPDLRSSVAMIMSFDASAMHRLRVELDRLIVAPESQNLRMSMGMGIGNLPPRVTSYDHFGRMSFSGMGAGGGFGSGTSMRNLRMSKGSVGKLPGIGRSNRNLLSMADIGLSISQATLDTPEIMEDEEYKEAPSSEEEEEEEDVFTETQFRAFQNMPKLMLLTVADPPKIACELQVKHNELDRVDDWLMQDDGCLDGVYLQFEKEMMTTEGAACLRELSDRFQVGIWGYSNRDPDDFQTFEVCLCCVYDKCWGVFGLSVCHMVFINVHDISYSIISLFYNPNSILSQREIVPL